MNADPIKTARLFSSGGSQAVRLPAEFRFEGTEVLIRRDARSGDVVLSPVKAVSWAAFAALREQWPKSWLQKAWRTISRTASSRWMALATPTRTGSSRTEQVRAPRERGLHAGHQCQQRCHPR